VNALSKQFWDTWLSMDLGSKVMEKYIHWSRYTHSYNVVSKQTYNWA
jgi:hypothetical protein